MTIATDVPRVSYTGNGVTTNFTAPGKFLADGDLTVIRKTIATGAEVTLVLNTDYTVSGAGDESGSITTIGAGSPLSSSYKITIFNDPDKIQEVDLTENDSLPAEVVEGALDRLTLITQRLSNWISRTMKLSEGTPDGVFDPTLPVDLILYPGTVPIVNADGDGWELAENWPTAEDIENAEEEAAAAAASAAASAASAAASAASAAVFNTLMTETQFVVANAQAVAASITGLLFDEAVYRSVEVRYTMERRSATQGYRQHGRLIATYEAFAGAWSIANIVDSGSSGPDTGVTFSITSGGQIQYTSDDVTGGTYVGKMRHRSFMLFAKET